MKKAFLGLAVILAGLVIGEAQITIPHTFTAGTTISSTQVNTNFSTLGTNSLNRTGGTMTGSLTTVGVLPSADNTYDFGSSSFRYANVYGTQLRGAGGNITALNATNLSTGTVDIARLPYTENSLADGRCTLTTALPVTTADVTAATTVYYTPYKGNRISLYDGSATWNTRTFSELSLSLGSDTADKNYDLFVYDNAGVAAIERLVWTNDTTRATALVLQDGVLVKSGATTRRYACTYRTTGVAGQTEDSFAKRLLWNYYNRVFRSMRYMQSDATWQYTTNTLRQVNANTANQLAVVVGVAEAQLSIFARARAANSGVTPNTEIAIGDGSTTTAATPSEFTTQAQTTANVPLHFAFAHYLTYPTAGYHFYVPLERSEAAGTTTWYGSGVYQAIWCDTFQG